MLNFRNPFITLIVIFPLLLSGQEKIAYVSKVTIGNFKCAHVKKVNLETKDTTFYIDIKFMEVGGSGEFDQPFIIKENNELLTLVNDLEFALKQLNTNDELKWDRGNYLLYKKASNHREIYFRNKNDGALVGYTNISKKSIIKLIDWFKTITLK